MNKIRSTKGITLISLMVTIIILLILAGVTLNLTLGERGIFKVARDAGEETKEKSATEKVQLMLADYMPEKYIGTRTLEEYLNEQKEKGKLDEVTKNADGTITVEVDGYEITIKEDNLSIIETTKAGGVKPTFDVYITKINGATIEPSEDETLEQKAITINITNIGEFGNNYTIEVKDKDGNVLTKETNVISGVTGQESYIINKKGSYTITVTGTKDGTPKKATKTEEIKIAMPTVAESAMFSKANGVIDIVWLDTNNNVIPNPISPKDYLAGLTAVKFNTTTNVFDPITNTATDTSWYNYEAQTGNVDGKTSNWANARSSDGNAYFVWIPRYAYKITYFSSPTQAQNYRENGSTDGIVGYSNINGMVKVENGVEKLLVDSAPTNVTGTVQTNGYKDYIVHPAFQFGDGTTGVKAGIWVGKFESSGSTSAVKIVPNTASLRSTTVGAMFTASLGVKNTYSLTGDSHLMKNTEWGAVAYLAESKYGRNGAEIAINSNSSYSTGGENYVSNVGQSTTGNIYGIYDMSGGAWEYVAGVLGSKLSNSSYYNFTGTDEKYYNTYASYNESKKIKGDAIYETSTGSSNSTSWHQDCSIFVYSSNPVFLRGRLLQ